MRKVSLGTPVEDGDSVRLCRMASKRKRYSPHPERDCSEECGAKDCASNIKDRRTYHLSLLEVRRRDFSKTVLQVDDDTCLCGRCYNQASLLWQQHNSSAGATEVEPPVKKKAGEKKLCILNAVHKCEAPSKSATRCDDWPAFVTLFELHQLELSPMTSLELCSPHYMQRYMYQRQRRCGICRKYFQGGTRPNSIPDFKRLHTYFLEKGDTKADLQEDTKVCLNCYSDLRKLSKQLDVISFNDRFSSDEEISSLLALYEGYVSQPANPENTPLHRAIVYCLRHLLHHKPFLLSDVYEHYRSFVDDKAGASQVAVPSYMTQSTLLSKLMVTMSNHMRQATIAAEPSVGTLLWRSGDNTADLLLRHLNLHRKSSRRSEMQETKDLPSDQDDGDVLQQSAVILRDDIKALSTDFKAKSRTQDFTQFEIPEVVASLPPRLWNFFTMMTESNSQKTTREQTVEQGWFHNRVYRPVSSTDASHRHLLRILFQICHNVYTYDDRCSYPLHTLLGEAVHGLGGADELVRILNRFGIVSSLSKIRSHELDFIYKKVKYGWSEVFTKGAFCFVSVDNVDKASAHASVKAGGGPRGIHATSYQLVEPSPSCLTAPEGEIHQPTAVQRAIRLPDNITVKDIEDIRREARPSVIFWDRRHPPRPSGRIEDFSIRPEEQQSVDETTAALLAYGTCKACIRSNQDEEPSILLPDLNLVCPRPVIPKAEKSKVYYLGVLNEHADNINTVKEVVETIQLEVLAQRNIESLIIVGDGKTYFHLTRLKQEYASELGWMIPFPGDWHTLKNFQPVLMKIYWHAGLAEIAGTVHKGATLNSVYQCSNFRRTHDFILLAWEAMLRTQLQSFKEYIVQSPNVDVPENFMEKVADRLASLPSLDASSTPKIMFEVWTMIGGQKFADEFAQFRNKMSVDETLKFWDGFIHKDALAYIMMFVAMRTGNLRLGALKLMSPLFHAFDRPTYLRLIPRHLVDVLNMPQSVLSYLQNGGFVASLKGIEGRSVAADECHEMKINKEVKMAMSKAIPSMMDRLALLLPYRAIAVEKLKEEVHSKEKVVPYINTTEAMNMEAKVVKYMTKLANTKLSSFCPPESVVPLETLSGELADASQREDMLTFHEIGSQSLESYISSRILGQPSVDAPQRKKRLKTFVQRKKRQSKVSLKAKNRKLVTRCLRKIIVQSKTTNMPIETLGQFIKLPLAIANPKGTMVHGNKANTTKVFRRRYPMAFTKALPPDWKPECVVLEGMFLINSSPLRSASVFRDYTQHLLRNFILPRFASGVVEVHVIFDDPGRHGDSPKDLERQRRDAEVPASNQSETEEPDIGPHTKLPDRSTATWRQAVLEKRNTKRKLVNFLAADLLEVAQSILKKGQRLITAGGYDGSLRDKAMAATSDGIMIDENHSSNHEESDSRVWLHCMQTQLSRVLVYSPDTDTYHIGLRVLIGAGGHVKKEAVVQLSMQPDNHEYLSISYLVSCLRTDPDLDLLVKDDLPTIVQAIYVASGCDYTSFFFGCGKASFLSAFYMHAAFITGRAMQGSLADCDVESEQGLLAFLRLVGCVYFQKFSSVMPSEHKTPRQLYHSFNGSATLREQHQLWLNCIRDHSWEKIDSEEDVMPSYHALRYHWQRCCWVLQLWGQAANQTVSQQTLASFGYQIDGDIISPMWDSDENIQKVEDLVKELTTGCRCKSGCTTRRCSCNKNHKMCGAGCGCSNCFNPHKDNTCAECCVQTEAAVSHMQQLQDLTADEDMHMTGMQPDDTVLETYSDSEDDEGDSAPEEADGADSGSDADY